MKPNRILLVVACLVLGFTTAVAKEITKTTFLVEQMDCESCASKVKKNLRFEKGMKKIEVNLKNKTVILTYDADKTDVKKLIKGFAKIHYEAVPVTEKELKALPKHNHEEHEHEHHHHH